MAARHVVTELKSTVKFLNSTTFQFHWGSAGYNCRDSDLAVTLHCLQLGCYWGPTDCTSLACYTVHSEHQKHKSRRSWTCRFFVLYFDCTFDVAVGFHHAYHAVPLQLPHLCHSSSAAAFVQPLSRFSIYGATFTQQCSLLCIHAALRRRSYAVELTQQHVCCSAHTVTFFRRSHAVALMPSLSRSIYAASLALPYFDRSIHTAASLRLTQHRSSSIYAVAPPLRHGFQICLHDRVFRNTLCHCHAKSVPQLITYVSKHTVMQKAYLSL